MNNNYFENFKDLPFFCKSPYGIIIVSIDGKILLLNDTAKSIFDINLKKEILFYEIFEEEEKIKNAFKNIKEKRYYSLITKTKLKYSKSNYNKEFQIEMHYIYDDQAKTEYILAFLRSYGQLNELIDIFDIHSNYFYSLLNLITDPIFIKNEEKKYIIINKHFENLFGIPKEEIINKTDYDLFSPQEAKDYARSDQYVLTQNLTLSEISWKKFPVNKKSTKIDLFCFNTIKSPIMSNSGKIIGLIGICKDITSNQLKLLEQKSNNYLFKTIEESMYNLLENFNFQKVLKNCLKSIFENLSLSSIAFYFKANESHSKLSLKSSYFATKKSNFSNYNKIIKINDIVDLVNEKLENDKYIIIKKLNEKILNTFFSINKSKNYIINKVKDELIFFPVIHNKELKALLVITYEKEELFDYFKGEVFDYVKYFGLTNSQKQALSIFSYFLYELIDKRNEEIVLKEYSNNLELIQQTVKIAFWTENLLNNEIKFSKYINNLINIPLKKSINRKIFLSYFDKNAKRKLKRFYFKIKKNDFTKSIIPIKIADNYKKIFCFYGKKFENNLIVVLLDITQQKNLEDELLRNIKEVEKANKIANDANEDKSNFLAFLSHELKNMLTATTGITSLLAERLKGKEEDSIALTLKKNSEQTLELINNILEFSKIESNKIELNFKTFSLRNFSDQIEEYYYFLAKEKGLDFAIIIQPDVEDFFISDKIRLRQILMNLIGNSLKFTPKGFIKINILRELSDKASEKKLIFKIEDTGIGISEKDLPNIFKPFNQANNQIYQKYGGTGLGLSIVKNLVDLFNGQISVNSIKNSGTVFRIELPYDENDDLNYKYNKNEECQIKNIHLKYNSVDHEDIDFIDYIDKIRKIKILNKNDKISIFISLENNLIKEKIISLLEYLKIKFNFFDLIQIKEFKFNLNDFNEKHLRSPKRTNTFFIIDKQNYQKIDNKVNFSQGIIFYEDKAFIECSKYTIEKPYTYKKLIKAIIDSFIS